MRHYLRAHYLLVFGGVALGLAIGIFVIDYDPAFVGWIVGAGIGLSAGAYVAAISSGEPLVGGSGRDRGNWTLDELYGTEDQAAPSSTAQGTNGHHRT